jgi:hypothetical protein
MRSVHSVHARRRGGPATGTAARSNPLAGWLLVLFALAPSALSAQEVPDPTGTLVAQVLSEDTDSIRLRFRTSAECPDYRWDSNLSTYNGYTESQPYRTRTLSKGADSFTVTMTLRCASEDRTALSGGSLTTQYTVAGTAPPEPPPADSTLAARVDSLEMRLDSLAVQHAVDLLVVETAISSLNRKVDSLHALPPDTVPPIPPDTTPPPPTGTPTFADVGTAIRVSWEPSAGATGYDYNGEGVAGTVTAPTVDLPPDWSGWFCVWPAGYEGQVEQMCNSYDQMPPPEEDVTNVAAVYRTEPNIRPDRVCVGVTWDGKDPALLLSPREDAVEAPASPGAEWCQYRPGMTGDGGEQEGCIFTLDGDAYDWCVISGWVTEPPPVVDDAYDNGDGTVTIIWTDRAGVTEYGTSLYPTSNPNANCAANDRPVVSPHTRTHSCAAGTQVFAKLLMFDATGFVGEEQIGQAFTISGGTPPGGFVPDSLSMYPDPIVLDVGETVDVYVIAWAGTSPLWCEGVWYDAVQTGPDTWANAGTVAVDEACLVDWCTTDPAVISITVAGQQAPACPTTIAASTSVASALGTQGPVAGSCDALNDWNEQNGRPRYYVWSTALGGTCASQAADAYARSITGGGT